MPDQCRTGGPPTARAAPDDPAGPGGVHRPRPKLQLHLQHRDRPHQPDVHELEQIARVYRVTLSELLQDGGGGGGEPEGGPSLEDSLGPRLAALYEGLTAEDQELAVGIYPAADAGGDGGGSEGAAPV